MKAVIARSYKSTVEVADVDEPSAGPKDVTIAVRAASLNPIDYKIRDGKLKMVMSLKMPIRLGCDVAGVVRAVGPQVTRFAVGDEVYARLEKGRMGGLAEVAVADEGVVAKKPAKATFEEAASVPLAGLTALQAMREVAHLEPGQKLLVHAGAGGVGSLAIQIGKRLGLWVATTTSTKNIELVRSLGADEVVDYTKEKVTDKLEDLDAVFDTLGTTELESIAVTKRGGTVVGIGGMPDLDFARERLPWFARPVVRFATRARRAAEAAAGVRFVYLFMRPDGVQLAEMAGWIDAGELKPVLHKVYPLAEAAEAFAELERGRARGKVVVRVA